MEHPQRENPEPKYGIEKEVLYRLWYKWRGICTRSKIQDEGQIHQQVRLDREPADTDHEAATGKHEAAKTGSILL